MATRNGSRQLLALGLAVGMGAWLASTPAQAQVRERDVKITGPRGKTLERHLESVRTPNGITREMSVSRPSGTFSREVNVQRAPGMGGPPPGFRPPHLGGPGPRPGMILERDVIVRDGGRGPNPWATLGIGAALGTGAGLLMGSALAAPRPAPVVVAPAAPVYVTPAPVMAAPMVVQQPAVVQQVVTAPAAHDPVPAEIARFSSWHENSRRDAALTLGRLRDPRAIPALVDRLKNDKATAVRVAAATALGDIGVPDSVTILERAVIYDKKQEVRDAATASIARISQAQQAAQAEMAARQDRNARAAVESAERVPPPPTPASEIR